MVLIDVEEVELNNLLARVGSDDIANAEALDGFIAALACLPDKTDPDTYLPYIHASKTEAFGLSSAEHARFVGLIERHYDYVSSQLQGGEVYLPRILEDEFGQWLGNDWANGFLAGTTVDSEAWASVLEDQKRGLLMVPICILAYERHPDPALRPYKTPIEADLRERLIINATANVIRMRHHFHELQSTAFITGDHLLVGQYVEERAVDAQRKAPGPLLN